MRGQRILLIIGGGIAAYKSLELIRLLKGRGADVVPVLTSGAEEFITPLSAAALAGTPAHTALFDLSREAEMGHIELSRSADLVVVAPATADLMAKMAGGHANDLASTLLMATDKRVLIAPAMNVRMWQHPATQRNLATLLSDEILVVGPDEGDMACGEFGPGRLAEPPAIVAAIAAALSAGPLSGRRVLVTSGPTHEPIDPVRYIANRSSGAQGSAIARACAALGAEVVFVTGPATAPRPGGAEIVEVETAAEMAAAAEATLPVDVAICAAAVADWHVVGAGTSKLKKDPSGTPRTLRFAENPDILRHLSNHPTSRPHLVVGFAAETDDVAAAAVAKRARKGCDWILANDVRPETGIMGGRETELLLVTASGVEPWPRMDKDMAASRLAARVAETLTPTREAAE
ncbi:MAG: bifunctional phosphopantothenoylcysteine decarboxylase/phosphopantothenate--cysteine ligase CoaBC [Pseudomonadota bacterium]